MSDDYRGSNMMAMAEAHQKAHAVDTQNDRAPSCSSCGTMAEDLLNSTVSKLLLCSRCQSAQYCSKECQTKDWPQHKKVCKKLAKERKAQEEARREMKESDLQKRIYALADEYPDDLPGQAKAFIGMLASARKGDLTAIACSNRIADDLELELLNECHNQGDAFYPVLCTLLEQDLASIQAPAFGKAVSLPSWHMATSVLRCFPGERGYERPSTSGCVRSYSEERSAAYFATCWKAHLDLSVGLWKASRGGSPNLYPVCKDFWRQLPLCLVHQSVARAIFQTDKQDLVPFSNHQSSRLKPLLGMLDLHDMADDLEGLTNQVAALLVIHARNILDNDVVCPFELERSFTRRMDRYQKTQWREMSLAVARAMVERKRQLSNDEFSYILKRFHRGR